LRHTPLQSWILSQGHSDIPFTGPVSTNPNFPSTSLRPTAEPLEGRMWVSPKGAGAPRTSAPSLPGAAAACQLDAQGSSSFKSPRRHWPTAALHLSHVLAAAAVGLLHALATAAAANLKVFCCLLLPPAPCGCGLFSPPPPLRCICFMFCSRNLCQGSRRRHRHYAAAGWACVFGSFWTLPMPPLPRRVAAPPPLPTRACLQTPPCYNLAICCRHLAPGWGPGGSPPPLSPSAPLWWR
jgi:hypothetical protein